jgi:ComF family protein
MAEKNVRRLIYRAGVSLLDLLFPPRCHVCAAFDAGLVPGTTSMCDDCFSQLVFIGSPLCKRCGCPFEMSARGADHHCPACLKKAPAYDTARSLLSYQAPVPELLHRLKYRADSSVVGPISQIIAHNGIIWEQETCDLIIPVPLHARRLRRRGLNQSHLLARLAFPADQEKIAINLLERVKNTNPQTGLDGIERRRNLKNAFHVTSPDRIEGASVWLVDDVFTTGTTVSECSKTLKKSGAKEVHVWTLARV